jgi:hypothetical protein
MEYYSIDFLRCTKNVCLSIEKKSHFIYNLAMFVNTYLLTKEDYSHENQNIQQKADLKQKDRCRFTRKRNG